MSACLGFLYSTLLSFLSSFFFFFNDTATTEIYTLSLHDALPISQQWKLEGTHLAALKAHYDAGATFISPYYFSVINQRFKGAAEHGVNRMELSPDNPKDGSDKFYKAIVEFARQ